MPDILQIGGRVWPDGRSAVVEIHGEWTERGYKHRAMFPEAVYAGCYSGTGVVDQLLDRFVKSGADVMWRADIVVRWAR